MRMSSAYQWSRAFAVRLEGGQQFNAYQDAGKGNWFCVALGPVTDHISLGWMNAEAADIVVDALRSLAGQRPAMCRCVDLLHEEGS